MATSNLVINMQIVGGPQALVSRSKAIEAYDKIEVSIEPGATNKEVEIQPGPANRVSFLLITSNLYSQDDALKKITYIVNDRSTDSSSVELDEPHLFFGKGAVSVFGRAPIILKFTSTYPVAPANKAAVEILVGRDPTPL
jgi:hypothetical protein